MAYLDYKNRIKRVDFSKINTVLPIPNLIKVQQESYEEFLQKDASPERRRTVGLQAVFRGIFPISDYNGRAALDFISYTIGQPKWSEEECRERGHTYSAPIKLQARISTYDVDEKTGAKSLRADKEQEVFFGDIPLMSERATFIINGTERVIVSQLHRSPGVFFEHDKGRSHASGKILFSARVIPYRGSWLDFEFDHKDMLYLKIDRKRKFPIAVLLRAFGKTTEELLRLFYEVEDVTVEGNSLTKPFRPELMVGLRMPVEMKTLAGETAFKKGVKVSKKRVERYQREGAAFGNITLPLEDLVGKVAVSDVADASTGELVVECGQEITEALLQRIRERGVSSLSVFSLETSDRAVWEGLVTDKIRTREEALKEIYKKMRPGDPPTRDASETLFENLFFNPDRYSLSKVGRLKLNHKLGVKDGDPDLTVLTQDDIIRVIRYLIDLKNGAAGTEADDIDNLGNRRVRTVGELIENQFRSGLVRVDRAIKEKMAIQDIETLMPHDLINAKPVTAMIKEFFGSSQLSQFMDQTNPLSEVTHKRRVSALGPGGLTRDRAGFEVRDVHPTHYGRICPIETPEGPNIGLIASLSTFARINDYGFIETPYRVVKDGAVTEEIVYLTAMDEDPHVIAQANAEFDKATGKLERDVVIARKKGDFAMVRSSEVTLMDVSPNQLVSVAASMIPFLEHDDANRALMGSNMQRQAVPLLRTEPPFVGTGMEPVVARDSGAAVTARRSGQVESIDARRIVVRASEPDEAGKYGADIYNLVKYRRSNQNTCINQKPIVSLGQAVSRDEVIADGPATKDGDLALGRNILVAFMPWGGYNFEDSILVNEKIIRDDIFTSIHIEEFECFARETKLGKEEITADIPNISEESLKDLDESGIVRIGARVKPVDILVGKVTPKGETQLTPEEKLLRAIFGEKAGDVKDSSLRVPPGVEGIVIDAKVFSRKGGDKDESASRFEEKEHERLLRDQDDEIRITFDNACSRIRNLVLGKTLGGRVVDDEGQVLAPKRKKVTQELLDEIPREYWGQLSAEEEPGSKELVATLFKEAQDQIHLTRAVFEEKISRLKKGDELPPGVLKMVKVYIAMKRKLSVGDKMAGRHGNKGVISRVLPEEDMPYLADGTPVDIVLNPLGVPSRMNVGQIMEAHLGWAAMGLSKQFREMVDRVTSPRAIRERLAAIHRSPRFRAYLDTLDDEQVLAVARKYAEGVHVASPVFAGATEEEIKGVLREAGLPDSGQVNLFDGKTGNPFQQPVTVGSMYMLKLHHLVDDKIHARSTGPYSLVTQQPLGGKAQFGGQRLGEMEVWALEAYGAAYTLQEFLTVKSDDVPGRARMYEAIVKGNFSLEPGLPESFNVLIKELQALGLNVELNGDETEPSAAPQPSLATANR